MKKLVLIHCPAERRPRRQWKERGVGGYEVEEGLSGGASWTRVRGAYEGCCRKERTARHVREGAQNGLVRAAIFT